MYFPKYRFRKTWLDNCLKSKVPEDPLIDNMAIGSKQWGKLLITVEVDGLEEVSHSDTQNPQILC